MKDEGTLREIQSTPGDVVECIDNLAAGRSLIVGKHYEIGEDSLFEDEDGDRFDWQRPEFRIVSRATPTAATPNKYQRTIKGVTIDVYDVLAAFNVTNPATQHAIKKLLMPGQRGSKDTVQDYKEAAQAVARAIEMEEE